MTNTAYQSMRMTRADFVVAVAFRKPVAIGYVKDDGTVTARVIEPHEVRETQDGNFIVVAMCRFRGEMRHFRLDRVTHYTLKRPGFLLELPKPADPEEVTNWWTVTSRSGHEVAQVEVVIPADVPDGERYRYVGDEVCRRSAKIRAVSKAEGGVGLRRLRRKDVLAWR